LFGMTVDEALSCLEERPANDGVDGDIVAEGNGEMNGRAIGKCVWEDVSDHSTKEPMEIGGGESVGVSDSSSEADRFERCIGVIKVDEREDTSGVGLGEGCMIRIQPAIASSTGVEEGREFGDERRVWFTKAKEDGWEAVRDGDRDGASSRCWGEMIGADTNNQLDDGFGTIKSASLTFGGGSIGLSGVGNGDTGGGGSWFRGWGVDNLIFGIADDGVSVVIKAASVRVVGKEVAEELLLCGRVITFGARFTLTVRET
jgi:hypothetical protein